MAANADADAPWLVICRGIPREKNLDPYPYSSKPLPMARGMDIPGHGEGFFGGLGVQKSRG